MTTCKTCPFWFFDGVPIDHLSLNDAIEVDEGECRRHPPTLIATPDDDDRCVASFFPDMSADQWCGEHPERRPKG